MIPPATEEVHAFHTPRTVTASELGDQIAQLVWESFSDFIADGDAEALLGLTPENGATYDHAAEEMLIFFLWAHTRAVQQAFLSRAPEERVRDGLDALHRAVFQDMVEQGTPPGQLPLFEQRVGARYAEYATAATASDVAVGQAVVRHLTRNSPNPETLSQALADQAVAVANPLRDFLEEVDLVD